MAVVELAAELQALVDPHADRFAEQLLRANGRAVVPGLLSGSPDLIKAAHSKPHPVLPAPRRGEGERRACVHVRASPRPRWHRPIWRTPPSAPWTQTAACVRPDATFIQAVIPKDDQKPLMLVGAH
jgi:hypothetical protein